MPDMFIYDRDSAEKKTLTCFIKDAVALLSDDDLMLWEFQRLCEATEFLQSENLVDMAVVEIRKREDIRLSEFFRTKQEGADLLLVSDSSISPMEYMTPKIRACSLLLRPFSVRLAKQTVSEFVSAFYRKQQDLDDKKVLVLENRQGKRKIPFSQIYYLEVREKKIYIRLRDREYSKYDTLENILKILPEQFRRCHRSFVFNMNYFQCVKLSENIIYLEHGITVPLSRSYKAEIKEYLDGMRSI